MESYGEIGRVPVNLFKRKSARFRTLLGLGLDRELVDDGNDDRQSEQRRGQHLGAFGQHGVSGSAVVAANCFGLAAGQRGHAAFALLHGDQSDDGDGSQNQNDRADDIQYAHC